MGNILNNNDVFFKFRINNDEYWDFSLSNDVTYNEEDSDNCTIAYIDTTNSDCVWFDTLQSVEDYKWDCAITDDIKLTYIGCVGVDNGFISYEKDRISNEMFYNMFFNSSYSLSKDDYRLKLYKVKGNNQIYDYTSDIVEHDGMTVTRLNGGFYQGFFKLKGYDYEILPTNVDDGWTFTMTLKKSNLMKNGYTLNDEYPDNKGIFLYIGTRAENKWWVKYDVDTDFDSRCGSYSNGEYFSDTYSSEPDVNTNYLVPAESCGVYGYDDYFSDSYIGDENSTCGNCGNNISPIGDDYLLTHPEFLSTYQDNSIWYNRDGGILVNNEQITSTSYGISNRKCGCVKRMDKSSIDNEYFNGEYRDCNMYATDEYINKEKYIDAEETPYSYGNIPFNQPNVMEIETDNKFIIFDRTEEGYNIENWNDGDTMILSQVKKPDIGNYFTLFDRTKDGYDINSIEKLIEENNKKYNVLSDIYRNALAFQIRDNGSIGYKYLVKDCNSNDETYKIESEYSADGAFTDEEWHTISVKVMSIKNAITNVDSTMRIIMYVDGKLKLTSKELPMLNLKALDDLEEKQQGVPYNISIGGGTQGLCDVVYTDFLKTPTHILPLEKEFAGTFVGYVKSFTMYNCQLSFSQIKNVTVLKKL